MLDTISSLLSSRAHNIDTVEVQVALEGKGAALASANLRVFYKQALKMIGTL
jgi:hypothetical protein